MRVLFVRPSALMCSEIARVLWKFSQVCDPRRRFADHGRPVRCEPPLPRHLGVHDRRALYIHTQGPPSRRTTG
ncbi:hypothetical protein [Streptomyces daghestanicus]